MQVIHNLCILFTKVPQQLLEEKHASVDIPRKIYREKKIER